MRTFLLSAALLICINFGFAQSIVYEPIGTPKIKDGNYNSIVKYHNYGNNTIATYELVVTVKGERVIAIHFPNEGSLHAGQNNSNYVYSGGSLSKDISYDNGIPFIKSAKTTIQIRYSNGGIVAFTVYLE